MNVVKSKTLHEVENDTEYYGCTFYLEHRIEELANCKFDNCSFRNRRVEIAKMENCRFINCAFTEFFIRKADKYFNEEQDHYSKSVPNEQDLLVIKTAKTEEEINRAAREGFFPLIKVIYPDETIGSPLFVSQHKKTGEIYTRYMESSQDIKPLINSYYYPHRFPNPFAAYLIPKDLKKGTRVWVECVIQDIVAAFGNEGYNSNSRLISGEAIWNGKDLEIQFNPNTDAEVWLG
ncbi:hypothetical protein [Candidatus Uabimicrobium sp. HlEnr_7]|uniref:hypothetical protein n=1 Tax=Candidatus Uabimicrobium helgolandensis TaxID=3095367 RepID=UPI003556D871